MTERTERGGRWEDTDPGADDKKSFKKLTKEEVAALRAQDPPVSPWRVIAVQAVVGGVIALLAGVLTGRSAMAWSALYGAATVVLPGALLARGMTSQLSSASLGLGAVSFMLWEFMKIGVSVVMLLLAPRLVPGLSWPALLVALVVCIKVYWLALLWRGR
jgi:ATP synthase protein I